jgi:hypothetical protein
VADGSEGHATAIPLTQRTVLPVPAMVTDGFRQVVIAQRPPKKTIPWKTIAGVIVMMLACLFAVNMAMGPGGLPGVLREQFATNPVTQHPRDLQIPTPPRSDTTPATQDPTDTLPPWISETTHTWNGTMNGNNHQLSFVLQLRLDSFGRTNGYIAWTVQRLEGARSGEQFRETIEGTYDATLGLLDLHGVFSTNPAVMPVNAYKLRMTSNGSLHGDTVDMQSHLTAVDAPVRDL